MLINHLDSSILVYENDFGSRCRRGVHFWPQEGAMLRWSLWFDVLQPAHHNFIVVENILPNVYVAKREEAKKEIL